ncbi:low molecular weight protein-tyrosine-phosphatase [Paenibacillus rigui]|uniref:protein-tyrosine-phosphatase n=1 Tax=Paenibacillus rigui TaxID=554312 RepID=A0A229UK70_9BACL|nr:low molecular weight protein-tyrosine-phosphatase [Paenibacillus rigui]OXM83771.1 protein tyrosine phosphatase [Paenibacillus rigui]
MAKVLFVCLGNICRSPMAEAVFRHKVAEAGLAGRIEIDSAGTGDWHTGEPPHEGTRTILRQNQIDYSGMRARQVRQSDFHEHRYIITMDASNTKNVMKWAPGSHDAEVRQLLDFIPERRGEDVPDPYYTGNFQEVYEMVDEACGLLLAYIRTKEDM